MEGGNGLRLSLFNHQHLAEVYRNPQNRNLQLPKTIVKPHRSNLQLPKSIVSPHNRIRQLPKPIVNPHTSTLQLPKPIVNPHNCIRQLPGASVSLHTSTRQLPEASVSLPATSALLGTRPRSHRRRVFTIGRAAASIHRADSPSSSQLSIVPTKTLRGLLADSNLNSQPPLPSPTPSASSCTPCRRA